MSALLDRIAAWVVKAVLSDWYWVMYAVAVVGIAYLLATAS